MKVGYAPVLAAAGAPVPGATLGWLGAGDPHAASSAAPPATLKTWMNVLRLMLRSSMRALLFVTPGLPAPRSTHSGIVGFHRSRIWPIRPRKQSSLWAPATPD